MVYLPIITLGALVFVIIFGILRPKVNIGILAVACAMFLGFGFMGIKDKDIAGFFPSQLFLMLVGITLFFGIADQNGTLGKILNVLVKLSRGNTAILPISFFLLTFVLSSIGPGNIASTALIAPIAMLVSVNTGVSPLLMAIMVCTGANAGAFSPISPTGIISTGLISKIGAVDPNYPILIFLAAAGIQSISAIAAYIIFKGYKIKGVYNATQISEQGAEGITMKQLVTLLSILILLVLTIFVKIPVCITVFVLAGLLLIFNIGDGEESLKKIPWDAILLVTGITVLIGVMEKAGGLSLAAELIVNVSNKSNVNAVLALITGIVSAYSSSSGVVMPAFIPLIPTIVQKIGTADLLHTIIAVNVGSHMVDVSPLSTLGAICIASVKTGTEKRRLFRSLMAWGISMAFVGSALSYVFLDLM